ncbi:MAG: formylglycine-generating enzyme family protein [Planctomycetota bacterium]
MIKLDAHAPWRPAAWLTAFAALAASSTTPAQSQPAGAPSGPHAEPLPANMSPYREALTETIGFDLVPIPGGTFAMGSPADEPSRDDDEGPVHPVRIAPFWMGRCEVTWDEYELWSASLDQGATSPDVDAVARPTPPYCDMTFGMEHDGHPAICMTQHAAKTYCQWLSAKTGHHYRLPTEAEWEWACRAGSTSAYSFGNDTAQLDEYAWFEANSEEEYHPVGSKKPNAWGLHDMHGNVAEWVLDQYAPEFYARCAEQGVAIAPLVEPTTEYPRTVRGGSFWDTPEHLRSAARLGSSPTWKEQDPQIPKSIWYHTDALFLGFRVVRPFATTNDDEAR